MKKTEFEHLAKMEEKYWWHAGRLRIIQKQLQLINKDKSNTQILNIGCGTGGTVPLLEQYGEVVNVDVSKEAIKYCEDKGVKNIHLYNGRNLPFSDSSFDIGVALDVLEHIKDDDEALMEWWRVLKPGGVLVMTVPAYQWLWSKHDDNLHHFRRYRAFRLKQMLISGGFEVKKCTYAIVFSFPLIAAFRVLRKVIGTEQKSTYVQLPTIINSLFTKLLYMEAKIITKVNFPFGTSILLIARKRDYEKN